MVAAATHVRDYNDIQKTLTAAAIANELHQLADGNAGYMKGLNAAASGDIRRFETRGQVVVPKAANIVLLDGQEVYWDRSAGAVTYAPGSDRDFFAGTMVGDAASGDATCTINLNVRASFLADLIASEFESTIVKTVVGSTTIEVPHIRRFGATHSLIFGATAEAQKLDLLSKIGFAVGSNWIVEGSFNVVDDGDAAAIDFNIGVANASHASDADSITESCFLHLDGNALDLYAESDDGTTEVAATDTTVNIALGTPVHFVIDGRNSADIQIYVNGVLMLGSTVFKLDAATGPLKLLVHLEKTSDDTTADYRVSMLRVRTAEQ